MAVEDHPLYKKWAKALDHLNDAERRYIKAKMTKGLPNVFVRLAKIDRDKAQTAYDKICEQLG